MEGTSSRRRVPLAKRLVVIGTSAGGIDALKALLGDLPASFPAPICIVIHMSPESPGILAEILDRASPLEVVNPRDGQRLKPGAVYVAPPNLHLLVEPGRVRVTKGPRENRFRPAIDPLFRSAAQVFGPAAIGVILTGNLDDGTAGLWTIKQMGGVTVVQDPDDAMFPSMPSHALTHVKVDHTVALATLPRLLLKLVSEPTRRVGEVAMPRHVDVEVKIAKEKNPRDAGLEDLATPSRYSCPECSGVLLQLEEGNRKRFRCHIGHAYSIESLLAAIQHKIEETMGVAVRSLEEGGLLMQQMAAHLETHRTDATRLEAGAEQARRHAEAIRELLLERGGTGVTRMNKETSSSRSDEV